MKNAQRKITTFTQRLVRWAFFSRGNGSLTSLQPYSDAKSQVRTQLIPGTIETRHVTHHQSAHKMKKLLRKAPPHIWWVRCVHVNCHVCHHQPPPSDIVAESEKKNERDWNRNYEKLLQHSSEFVIGRSDGGTRLQFCGFRLLLSSAVDVLRNSFLVATKWGELCHWYWGGFLSVSCCGFSRLVRDQAGFSLFLHNQFQGQSFHGGQWMYFLHWGLIFLFCHQFYSPKGTTPWYLIYLMIKMIRKSVCFEEILYQFGVSDLDIQKNRYTVFSDTYINFFLKKKKNQYRKIRIF